jgi:hypothetical protein
VTRPASSLPAKRRWSIARIVNNVTLYAVPLALGAPFLLMQAPGPAIAVVMVAGLIMVFLYDSDDSLDRMFWTQIAQGLHARALMRKPIRRLPVDPCPPALLAAAKSFDAHPHALLVAESGAGHLVVLDWTTWDQPDQDYYLLVAVDASGALSATTYFSKWPKAWGSRR